MTKINIKQINHNIASDGSIIIYDSNNNVWSNTSTNSILVPSGTTLERPNIPHNGHIRYNTINNQFDFYENNIWRTFSAPGEINIATNVGIGAGISRDKTGVSLNLRSIIGSSNIVVTQNIDDITLTATGIPVNIGDLVDVNTTITPSVGQVLEWNGTTWLPTNITSSNMFGAFFTQIENEGISTTTSTNWITKVKLTTITLPAGKYRIGWSYQWNHNSTHNDFEARIRLNNLTDVSLHKQEPKDASGSNSTTGTDQKFQTSGFKFINLIAGIHTLEIDYRTSNNNKESSIWNSRLELWRVS